MLLKVNSSLTMGFCSPSPEIKQRKKQEQKQKQKRQQYNLFQFIPEMVLNFPC